MEKNFSFPSAPVRRLRTKLTFAQVDVVPTSGKDFQFIIAGDDESLPELRLEQSGEELLIAQPQLAYAKEFLRRRWLQICVRVPGDWRGDLDIDTISGTISVHSIGGENISLTSVSGSMSIRDVEAAQTTLHTVSAAISGENLRGARGSVRTVAGKATLKSTAFGFTKLFTISGDLFLNPLAGSATVDMQSVSGSLAVETPLPVRASLNSLSGQFILGEHVPTAEDGLEITASSVSGNLAVQLQEPEKA